MEHGMQFQVRGGEWGGGEAGDGGGQRNENFPLKKVSRSS